MTEARKLSSDTSRSLASVSEPLQELDWTTASCGFRAPICDPSLRPAHQTAGWSVVSMKRGESFAIVSGQVGSDFPQGSGGAEMLATVTACSISPLIEQVHTDYAGALQLYKSPGYPRRNTHAGLKVLMGRAVASPESCLVSVQAHQDLSQYFNDNDAQNHAK
eukprot:920551-Pyramimonas_sp.AAC.1